MNHHLTCSMSSNYSRIIDISGPIIIISISISSRSRTAGLINVTIVVRLPDKYQQRHKYSIFTLWLCQHTHYYDDRVDNVGWGCWVNTRHPVTLLFPFPFLKFLPHFFRLPFLSMPQSGPQLHPWVWESSERYCGGNYMIALCGPTMWKGIWLYWGTAIIFMHIFSKRRRVNEKMRYLFWHKCNDSKIFTDRMETGPLQVK